MLSNSAEGRTLATHRRQPYSEVRLGAVLQILEVLDFILMGINLARSARICWTTEQSKSERFLLFSLKILLRLIFVLTKPTPAPSILSGYEPGLAQLAG